jgi:hypothetical protein
MPRCAHENFACNVRIGRLSETEGGPIRAYVAYVTVKCVDCGLPFRWLGLPHGLHYAEPRVSADATELRAPLEPAYVQEVLGIPKVSGRA